MRDTEFFKFIFFNVPLILGVTVVFLVGIVIILGLRHRRTLVEGEKLSVDVDQTMDADIDSKDQAALREVGLSSAGVGNIYYNKSKKRKKPADQADTED